MKTKILSFSIAILQITISLILIYGLYISLTFSLNTLVNYSTNFKYSDISIYKLFKKYLIELILFLIGLIGGILIFFKHKLGNILSLSFWSTLLISNIFAIIKIYTIDSNQPIEIKETIYLFGIIILYVILISFYIFKNKFSKKDYIFPITFLLFYIIIKLI